MRCSKQIVKNNEITLPIIEHNIQMYKKLPHKTRHSKQLFIALSVLQSYAQRIKDSMISGHSYLVAYAKCQ